jgi:hypothetical protein
VIGETEVSQFEREADEVREEVWRVDTSVDKNGAVDVRVGER